MKGFALNIVPERIDPQECIIRLQECFSESDTKRQKHFALNI